MAFPSFLQYRYTHVVLCDFCAKLFDLLAVSCDALVVRSDVVGLALCAVLMWADVDTQVARYNVRAYQSGKLETVDMVYLRDLGYSAVPYLEELTQDPDPDTAQRAANLLRNFYTFDHDIRSWNYAKARALPSLAQYRATVAAESAEVLTP